MDKNLEYEPVRGAHILMIVNPVSGRISGEHTADKLEAWLKENGAAVDRFETTETENGSGYTAKLAENDYARVVVLGGDGTLNAVLNGMLHRALRTPITYLPAGTTNDFAQTLGIEDFSGKNFGALLTCELQRQDIGRIRSWNPACGSGEATVEYYDQTLSVGIDAAIGLGTTELRKKTGLTGAPLYTLSGLEQFGLRYRNYPMTVSFDGAPAERVRAIVMAIQLGPTYGSGYRICPDADPCDGVLDICYACGPVPRAVALPMFLSAKDGHHTKLPAVRMRRCRHAALTFEEPDYPIQADGEPVVASRIEVDVLPAALEVWHPTR